MDLSEASEALGIITAFCALGALSNFVLKEVGRTYIKRLPAKYAGFASGYRNFMRFMVRRHRSFGFAALFFVLVHAYPVVARSAFSVTGLIAASLLAGTACLGMYGFYFRKNPRSTWLQVHRAFAVALVVAVAVHLFSRILVTL